MPTSFAYRGLDHLGATVRGEIQADDVQNATALLKARAIFPTAVTPVKEKSASPARRRLFSGGNLSADVSILTRQLANLIGGGVPMMSAFAALTGHTENERLRTVLEQMQDEVRGGKSLWEALGEHPDVFPTLYVNMVKAGEASGQLSAVLAWLADYQEKEQARRMQIRGALVYPLVLLTAGLLAIIILITVVVPKFTGMYSEFGQALPAPTVLLLAISGFLGHWGWAILVGVALLVVGVRRYEKTPSGTLYLDALRLRLPLLGKLTMKSAMSRFARTTTTLMQGGVPLLEALSVVRDVLGNEVLAQATDRAREGMREGERFGERLHETGQFPPLLTHMIGIGEETGDLRNMLNTVANTYDIEVDATLRALVSLLEPIIIVGIGSVMAFVIIAMLLPIFQIDMVGGG